MEPVKSPFLSCYLTLTAAIDQKLNFILPQRICCSTIFANNGGKLKKRKKYQKGFPHYCFSFLSKDSRRLGLVKIFNTWSPKHTGHISTQNQNKQKTKWWVRSSVFSECTHPRHQQDKSQLGKHKNSCFLPQVIVIYSSCFTAAR